MIYADMPLLKCQGDGSRDTHDSHLECVSGNRPLVFSKNARGTVSNDMEMCQKNNHVNDRHRRADENKMDILKKQEKIEGRFGDYSAFRTWSDCL
jgi:hypothetical protein